MAQNVSCSYCDASKSSKTNDEVTLYSFPEQRKNPVVYFKWCDVLNTEPKQEKLTKPLVCQNHFSRKDLDSTGLLKARAVPRLSLLNRKRNLKKPPARDIRKSEFIAITVKEEPISDGELHPAVVSNRHIVPVKFHSKRSTRKATPNQSDSHFIEELLSDVRKMDCMQKEHFKSEMMELIMNDIF